MEGNGWYPSQGNSAIASNDWRSELSAESRQKIVDKITETLKKCVPNSNCEGVPELNKIVLRFEEKTYALATSQADYLKKISLKMLAMESKSTNANPLLSNSVTGNQNPPDEGLQSMQQARNQGQSLSIPLVNPSQGQQILSQNFQNSIIPNPVQSPGFTSTLSSMSGITHTGLSSDPSQICNVQNMSGGSQNTVNHSIEHDIAQNVFANSQKKTQARHLLQQSAVEEHRQQPQNHQQLQNQHSLVNQPMQPKGNIQQSLLQPSNISLQQLQPNQLQPTQKSLMRPSEPPALPQSGYPCFQQSQASAIQTAQPSVIQHSEQTSPQHSVPSVIQRHQLSVLRQKQLQQSSMHPQPSVIHQQPSQMSQSTMQPQQHRMCNQQNLPNMHQQLAGQPSNMQHIHQQPQQLSQQVKSSLRQQLQQTSSALLQHHALQPQSRPSQQLMTQLQSQSTQAQQKIMMQQQSNPLQGEIQRIQSLGGLPQAAVEQQKELLQQQRGPPDTASFDPTAQPIHTDTVDWQEEAFQKIKVLKDMHFNDLNNLYQRLALKCQEHENLQTQMQSNQLEKVKHCRDAVKSMLTCLSVPKNSISVSFKDKISALENHILQILNAVRNRKFVAPSQQGHQQLPSHSSGQSLLLHHNQQEQHRMSQLQQYDSHANQLPSVNLQNTLTSMQPRAVTAMQHANIPLRQHPGVQSSQQTPRDVLHSGSHLDRSSLDSLQQGAISSLSQGVVGSLLPNTLNTGQQPNASTLPQSSASALHTNANFLQHHHQSKQLQPQNKQQVVPQSQLPHQCQQPQIQMQEKQIQQQMFPQSQVPHQCQQQEIQMHQMQKHSSQLQAHQLSDVNDLNLKTGMTHKPGQLQQQLSIGQRAAEYQQLNTLSSVSSPLTHATYSQISQNLSPQVDQVQQGLLSAMSFPKVGTPLQPANSPLVVRSPSTSVALSPLYDDSEKPGASPLSNTVNMMNQQSTILMSRSQSLATGTPGISASPALAELTTEDGNQVGHATALGSNGKTNAIESPLDRLIKAVTSVSSKAFASSVSDISSIVNLVDRMAGSAPGKGSRTPVGEDLVAITRCGLQARNVITQDSNAATRKMKRNINAMPLNTASSTGSVNNSILQLDVESSESESTATSSIKRSRVEVNPIILEELKEINLKLIDTVVEVGSEGRDITAVNAEGGDGTLVKCSYIGVALCPNVKSQCALAQTCPILCLRLLLPSSYPNCSPVLLDTLPVKVSEEGEDLATKAKRRFTLSVRGLQQPMSLGDMVKTWDVCARQVMTEYAQESGGGSFSSSYGTWDSCVGA